MTDDDHECGSFKLKQKKMVTYGTCVEAPAHAWMHASSRMIVLFGAGIDRFIQYKRIPML